MRFIRRSQRSRPEISFVLLDWGVRESFHLLHYLARQTVDRERFEIIVIEYYSRVSDAIRRFEDQVDTWLVLEMPQTACYHKHLMYNAGIVLSRGKIVAIGDSDAMVRETFVESILNVFRENSDIVLHVDQFRNNRRDLYPFSFPSFDEVLGDGCINNVNGVTRGLCDIVDPLHSRNYGACMCAVRSDLIAIGGADEHGDYLGHVCGPYDMTFRLINSGKREVWLEDEFTYHTWHPGQAGDGNYMGPHDGRHMSTTALRALLARRVLPLVENSAVRQLRLKETPESALPVDKLVDAERVTQWGKDDPFNRTQAECLETHFVESFWGARISRSMHRFTAEWIAEPPLHFRGHASLLGARSFSSIAEAKRNILEFIPFSLRLRVHAFATLTFVWRVTELAWKLVRRTRRMFGLHPRKISDRISQGVKERLLHSSDAANMIVLLVSRKNRNLHSPPKVVVLGKGDAVIMRLFIFLRILPMATVFEARDRNTARDVVAVTAKENGAVLFSSNAYVRFYSDFASCPRNKVLIV